jgi:hypothetical protein
MTSPNARREPHLIAGRQIAKPLFCRAPAMVEVEWVINARDSHLCSSAARASIVSSLQLRYPWVDSAVFADLLLSRLIGVLQLLCFVVSFSKLGFDLR